MRFLLDLYRTIKYRGKTDRLVTWRPLLSWSHLTQSPVNIIMWISAVEWKSKRQKERQNKEWKRTKSKMQHGKSRSEMETCVWSQAVRAGLRLGEKGPEKSGYFPWLCSIRLASIHGLIATDMRTLMKLGCKCDTPEGTRGPIKIHSQMHHLPMSEINLSIRINIYAVELI